MFSATAIACAHFRNGAKAFGQTFSHLRDYAIEAMRSSDLNPPWFTSANWDNGKYKPWTDYLIGKLSDPEFLTRCAQPSDYCLRDIWDLRSETPKRIDWRNSPPLNWSGVHALALRYARTGDPLYLKKWLAIVSDFAVNARRQNESGKTEALRKGTPAALLEAAMAWSGIFTAFALLAKTAGIEPENRGRKVDSLFGGRIEPVSEGALDLFPAQIVFEIASNFAKGDAIDLLHYYSSPRYVPNQRVFGLEALAYLVAFFPDLPAATEFEPHVNAALDDVFTRYHQLDGGQFEQSFNYAQGSVFAAERLTKLPFRRTPPWKVNAQRSIDGWYRMAAALAVPKGGLPQVGNNVWGKIGRYANPPRFGNASIAFPYSGYYVQRSSWDPDAAYLFFFFRREARGHTMAGCNSLQVGAYGRHLLAAGGSPNYKGKSRRFPQSPAYLGEHSTYKTNTILVDDRFQNGGSLQGLSLDDAGRPDIFTAPKEPIRSRWHSSDHFDFLEGTFDRGYKGTLENLAASLVTGITHRRQVVFIRSLKMWVVVDAMITDGKHLYTQVWKFSPPNNGLDLPGFEKGQVSIRAAERTIRTVDSGPNAVNVALTQFGIDTPKYRSYFAEGGFGYVGPAPLLEAVPGVDVHVNWTGSGNQVLVTAISPYRGQVSSLLSSTDLSKKGIGGCRLDMVDGSSVSVLASASARNLVPGPGKYSPAEMYVSLEKRGEQRRGLVIAENGSHEFSGNDRLPIGEPQGFRWKLTGANLLMPDYRAAP
ncbi:MAG: hypothetical protein AMS22_01390 [Thiotrichales bacterium SG8_50]|nr:MAG: hypothetical protein AMS22_01390 [Thiotrichales bacterium SG8_50]